MKYELKLGGSWRLQGLLGIQPIELGRVVLVTKSLGISDVAQIRLMSGLLDPSCTFSTIPELVPMKHQAARLSFYPVMDTFRF